MINFNYLNDAPPRAIETLRGFKIPDELKTPLAALATACVVVCAWWALERFWIERATHEETMAAERLVQSRAAFAATKLIRSNVEDLLALDGRVRKIRLSGSAMSERLAEIGNNVPTQAWLTSLSRSEAGLQIEGRAEGLNVLSQTMASFMSNHVGSPSLVRAVREDKAKGVIAFTMQLALGKAP